LHILIIKTPIWIDVPSGQNEIPITTVLKARRKRLRPFGSKDKNPRKKGGLNDQGDQIEELGIKKKTK
jgi:hypothetical protein